MKNFNFLNSLFSRITGIEKIDLSIPITVKNSNNTTITGNTINQSVINVFDGFAYKYANDDFDTDIKIDFKPTIANDKTKRTALNIDYLERFIFECNKQAIVPTIRCYAFFSHVSTIRSRGDTNEYNQLVLAEKDLFDKMLELDFHVKLIICLDIPVILEKWYNNISEAICRISSLCDVVDDICDSNIDIVIDEMSSLDGQFILDDVLFIHALNSDPIQKYNFTKYETNLVLVQNAIKRFDERFYYLTFTNNIVRNHFKISSMSALIRKTLDYRLEEINKSLAKK